MKPQDVIKQLVGNSSGWDQNDTLSFMIYNPEHFPDAGSAEVDFEKGIVNIYDRGHDEDNGIVSESFAIKAELVEITPDE